MYYGGMAQPVRSMTFDNGTEFADCDKVAKRHQARLFFTRPGCPQQRGSNENMNPAFYRIQITPPKLCDKPRSPARQAGPREIRNPKSEN